MLENFLGLIFPKICFRCGKIGSYLCSDCLPKIEVYGEEFCPVCAKAAIHGKTHPRCVSSWGLDGVVCFFKYDSLVKKLIHQIKYRFSTDVSEVFQSCFKKVNLPKSLTVFTLIPVPLDKQRENWRGFNQAEILAEFLVKGFSLKYDKNLLIRTTFGKSQVKLNLEERKENLKNAFVVKDKGKVSGKGFLLFDDVWTTGATMREAAKTLKRAGAKEVWALCLATSHKVH